MNTDLFSEIGYGVETVCRAYFSNKAQIDRPGFRIYDVINSSFFIEDKDLDIIDLFIIPSEARFGISFNISVCNHRETDYGLFIVRW